MNFTPHPAVTRYASKVLSPNERIAILKSKLLVCREFHKDLVRENINLRGEG
jgi:hypothetical protein